MYRRQILVLVTIPCSFIVFLFVAFESSKFASAKRMLATENSGFISIDCGVEEDYLDEKTGIFYKTDKDFISNGENRYISAEYNYVDDFRRLLTNLRVFPQGRKNCYTLKPQNGKNNNYLIRVFFKYGNYDGKYQVPKFDLYIGPNYWDTVELDNSDMYNWLFYEAVHFLLSEFIFVCLVNTGSGLPFISGLELRPLNNSIYRTDTGTAAIYPRYDLGNSINGTARYKNDVYDRLWLAYKYMTSEWVPIRTTLNMDTNHTDAYNLPIEVMRNAAQPRNDLHSLSFKTDYSYPLQVKFYVYFHFAEVQENVTNGREFTIDMSGDTYGPIRLQYLKSSTVRTNRSEVEGPIQFSINQTGESHLPPILNASEILTELPVVSPTNSSDVNAIMEIKQRYKINRLEWQGDPCLPIGFSWVGLGCTQYNAPSIISLNLSSSKLTGEIASEFSYLSSLQSLDLSNNELVGMVPEFLGQLQNLTFLNLTGNMLKGPIPRSLIEKSENGTLVLSFEEKSNQGKKRNLLLPLTASLVPISVLLLMSILVIFWRRRGTGSRNATLLKSKNRPFTYSEIIRITNKFQDIIGEGGFGKVYLGNLNDGSKVAVKLLSKSSKQGFREFQSEAQLLIMVYHRNLVSLVGYCDDCENMALVYEYMENGNLRHLLDTSMKDLTWSQRLQITIDAAQGLEYLHNGCKPPVIHRDLKTSNILLDENFLAKISDFGLSKVFNTDKDTHVTTNPAGTFGYLDAKFYASGNLNKKSDIYSFGIILFEIITGKPVIVQGEEYDTHILEWVIPLIERGDIMNVIDPQLKREFNTNSAWKAAEIAMSCVAQSVRERPDVSHVLAELKECLAMEMVVNSKKDERIGSNLEIDIGMSPKAR